MRKSGNRSTIRNVVIATGTAALTMLVAPGAMADPVANTGTTTATTIEKATGTQELLTGSGTLSADGAQVTLPTSADQPITATKSGDTVALTLPAAGAKDASSTSGTTVFAGREAAVSTAAQATTDGGFRALFTLENADAPRQQSFRLTLPDGATARTTAEGGLAVFDATGKMLGGLETPWAKDANGVAVPTSYEVVGDTVTQTVTPGPGTAFPVVADPKWTWGIISGTVYFNKKETSHLAANAGFVGVLFAAAPPPFDVYGVVNAANISRVAWNADSDGECVEVKVPTFLPYEYKGGYCK
ncbi:hypothetical protein [Streptomyces acidiscabies]|uniref:hypothetical protein n=1 Tax=Streptomyces acidiscabies TaxID=42234 RepID=UPI00076F09D9|nr:hypothetical protein [Streptomyces acidiscabies]GAQ58065.1 hypothetical protein a10_07950 [Streptomyces acidiscabies]